jgi:hypothetical protein
MQSCPKKLIALFISVVVVKTPNFATAAAEVSSTASPIESAQESYSPLRNLRGGFAELGSKKSVSTFAIGLVALAGARTQDEETNDYFRDQHRLGNWDQLGNEILGTGVPGVLVGSMFWIYGDLNERSYERHAGQAQIESLFVTSLVTSFGKGFSRRLRPDASDRYSFPSGHTSTVFASAAALDEFYGWKVGVPAYALGVLTGISRLSAGRHWLSDVTGGAVLGLLMGKAYSRYHLGQMSSTNDLAWLPVITEDGGLGLQLRAEF